MPTAHENLIDIDIDIGLGAHVVNDQAVRWRRKVQWRAKGAANVLANVLVAHLVHANHPFMRNTIRHSLLKG